MESITSERCDTSNLATLQKRVQEKLQNERYLLVLDDVWNQDQNKWYQLRAVLECGSKGASILVTTRDSSIASFMRTRDSTHELSNLSDDDCWSLFKQRAFPSDAEVSEELEEIGREIVNKCGGLPLAAQALGSFLQSKSDEKQWLAVKEGELWNLQGENLILSALRLSYFSLTPPSRRCFAFCAIFPKDKVINKEELTHLWMANGFISSREKLEIEDVGTKIWNELYHKSLFQEVTTDHDGCIRFKMHDLVHDLAQSVAEKECSVMKRDGDIINLPSSTHHISYIGDSLIFNKKDLKNVESLRTFLNLNYFSTLDFEKGHSLKELHGLNLCQRELSIKGLECVGNVDEAKGVNLIRKKELRVLSLSWGDDDSESEIKGVGVDAEQVIEALKPHSNLMKLEVYGYKGSHFPSWMKDVSCIKNLVSLNLEFCKKCVQLPTLGKLASLEKLEIWGMDCVQYMDDDESYDGVEVKAFISLKTLSLWDMPNLERLLKRERGVMFPSLHKLYISNCPELTLPCLPSIEELEICYSGEELVKSISSLRGVKSLKIAGCSKLPSQLKSLDALESLELRNCDEVECIPEQVMEGLCSLRCLNIIGCRAFKCLPEAIQHFTSIEILRIWWCPILEERCKEGSGEDWHKIQHIPNIDIRRGWRS
ncbi:putative disease resistance protein RGA1 [Senna tora]|uniref:Putative disease resistance protein RGA1 n=1 Tax=Senna tora TaxID=362788 RepID=A0A834WC45_9FABA|nr:putative disease resistance protein RGA1 [Senna tora]